MAWGIFNKIASGAKKVANVVGDLTNKVTPTVKKVISATKPLLSGTKYGKLLDKADTGLSYLDKVNNMINAKDLDGGIKSGINLYKSAKGMKPQYIDDEDEDESENDDY